MLTFEYQSLTQNEQQLRARARQICGFEYLSMSHSELRAKQFFFHGFIAFKVLTDSPIAIMDTVDLDQRD